MEGGTVAKAGRLKRYAQRLRELVRGLPVAPQGDDVYNAWTTLYGTPDIERILPTYEEYSRNAYNGNAVVFGLAVRRLMLFAEASLVLRDDEDKSLDDDPCLEMLETPWPNGTSSDLLARMIQDVDLAGNAYVRNCGDRLERLRPDWVTIVSKLEIDPLGREVRNVLGYMYEPLLDMGRKTEFYDVSEVAHWAPIPDPTANFRGMSWLTPVVREINADIAMSEHQYSYFRNAATPNLIIKYATELKKGALEHIRDQIAARHAGSDNAFSTMVLDKGADPMLVGSQLTDVSFGAIQAAGENRIAVAAGVPAIVAGLKEGLNAATLANFREAMEVFANLTMRPLWRSACAALSTIVNVPEGKELWYDTSDIAALQQGEQAIAATMQTNAATLSSLISAGFTPESSVKAVTSGDMTLLKHTGLYSVQLRPPGAQDPAAGANGAPGKPGGPNAAGDQGAADPNAAGDQGAAGGQPGTSTTDPNGATRAGYVWDELLRAWIPELHPRGPNGRFRRLDAVDLVKTVDMTTLSHRRLHGLFGSVSDDLYAGGHEGTHTAALHKLGDEMARREKVAADAAARKENPLHGVDLTKATDHELAQLLHDHPARQDVRLAVWHEQNWRRKDAHKAWQDTLKTTPLLDWQDHQGDTLEQRRIDKLVSSGHSYAEAYAMAYQLNDAKILREQRASLVDMHRMAGETRVQAVQRAYAEHTYLQYLDAEAATNGYFLSPEGKAKKIDPISLFSGPVSRARKYASEELLRYWGAAGNRRTYAEFAAETLTGDTRILADAKARGNGSEHGV